MSILSAAEERELLWMLGGFRGLFHGIIELNLFISSKFTLREIPCGEATAREDDGDGASVSISPSLAKIRRSLRVSAYLVLVPVVVT